MRPLLPITNPAYYETLARFPVEQLRFTEDTSGKATLFVVVVPHGTPRETAAEIAEVVTTAEWCGDVPVSVVARTETGYLPELYATDRRH